MSPVEVLTLEKKYVEMRKTYHMALDMIEAKNLELTQLRREVSETKTQKKADA